MEIHKNRQTIHDITLDNSFSKRGTYRAEYEIEGKRFTCGCGTSDVHDAYANAVKKRELKIEELKGSDNFAVLSLDDLIRRFLHFKLSGNKDTVKMYKSTCNKIRGYQLNHISSEPMNKDKRGIIIPLLMKGSEPIHKLTQDRFDSYVSEMQEVVTTTMVEDDASFQVTKPIMQDGTLRSHISRINTLFDYAKSLKTHNKAEDKRIPYAVPDVNFLKFTKEIGHSEIKSRPFTDDEVDLILNDLQRKRRYMHNYYKMIALLDSGCRIGEVCKWKRNDFNFDRMEIKISRLKKKRGTVVSVIAMNPRLAEKMQEYILTLPEDQEYLWEGKDGKPCKPQSSWFRESCKRCGLNNNNEVEKLVAHSARARMIQQQVDANQNLFLIMDSVGHTSPIVTQRYLRNSTSEGSKQASQIIQRNIDSRDALKAQLAQVELEAQAKKDAIYAKMEKLTDGLSDI